MAINLHEKYATKIVERMTKDSFIGGKTNTDYSWDGVKTVNVSALVPQQLNDYTRSGANRYGTPTDLQDTIQTLSITQDKSYSIVVDKGDNSEQQQIKNAGKVTQMQNKEIVIPFIDKYALGVWTKGAGTTTAAETLSDGDAVLTSLATAKVVLSNALFESDLYCYMPQTTYMKLALSKMILGVETLAKDQISKGVVGQILGFTVVAVPDNYLTGYNYLITNKKAVLQPTKLNELKLHQDPQGYSGNVMEFRCIFDAFVLDELKMGVYASKNA